MLDVFPCHSPLCGDSLSLSLELIASQPASSRGPQSFTSPEQGLQMHTIVPGFLCGARILNSDLSAFATVSLLKEPLCSPKPVAFQCRIGTCLHFLFLVVCLFALRWYLCVPQAASNSQSSCLSSLSAGMTGMRHCGQLDRTVVFTSHKALYKLWWVFTHCLCHIHLSIV